MDEVLKDFLTETAENLDVVDLELVGLEKNPGDRDAIAKIFRLVHTVKGTCGFLGLSRLQAVAHAGETLLGKFRDGSLAVTPDAISVILRAIDGIKAIVGHIEAHGIEPAGDDSALIAELTDMAERAARDARTIDPGLGRPLKPGEVSLEELEAVFRAAEGPDSPEAPREAPAATARAESAASSPSLRVSVEVVESLMTLVSELVLTRNELLERVRRSQEPALKIPIQRLSKITAELQDTVMQTRMQPIAHAWQKLPRLVRDLARDLGKSIELVTTGAETELDRQVLELIKDPLTHMVRNSCDHGLERPELRRAAGKPATGRITISASHAGGAILLEIADDGRGLDAQKIKSKALANGLASASELDAMTEAELQRFIFHPGLSTAATVSNVSGRGVGLDVVRTNIERIGGVIELASTAGEGTRFLITIPLTLAILPSLIVSAGGERFAIPQSSLLELVRTRATGTPRIEHLHTAPVLRLRGRLLPLVRLASVLRLVGTAELEAYVVVCEVGEQSFGLIVDDVFDTEEIVAKPMATALRGLSMLSGTTILGDGSVIMIVDVNGIAGTLREAKGVSSPRIAAEPSAAMGDRTPLVVFRAGGPEPKAMPLAHVARLEEIDTDRIERSGGRAVIQYRGALMPLVALDGAACSASGRRPVLVVSDGEGSLGLVVDEIFDIVEERLAIDLSSETAGVLGSAILRGRATEIIDIAWYLDGGVENAAAFDRDGPIATSLARLKRGWA